MAAKRTPIAFISEQIRNPDGSVTIRPVKVDDQREIDAAAAAKMLGLHVKTVHRLCNLGEEFGGLKAWKLPSAKGNAKWRINLGSVLSMRARNSPAG